MEWRFCRIEDYWGYCTTHWKSGTCWYGHKEARFHPKNRTPARPKGWPSSRRCWLSHRQSRQCSPSGGYPSPVVWFFCDGAYGKKITKMHMLWSFSGAITVPRKFLYSFTYSCKVLRKTREVYSKSSEVLDRLSATWLGLEKANAVPNEDWLSAPISATREENALVNNLRKWATRALAHCTFRRFWPLVTSTSRNGTIRGNYMLQGYFASKG